MDLDPALGRSEPDPEIRDPLKASAGLNLGLDYLPGSITFDPVAGPPRTPPPPRAIVLFDAFVTNVDRTPRNPNLLWWHRRFWLIDHGAALYFHHGWQDIGGRQPDPSSPVTRPRAPALGQRARRGGRAPRAPPSTSELIARSLDADPGRLARGRPGFAAATPPRRLRALAARSA